MIVRQRHRGAGAIRVLFAMYSNPATYPPIIRAANMLRDAGCAVRIVGTYGQRIDGLDVRAIPGLDIRLVARAGSGLRLKAGYLVFMFSALWNIVRWRPDWVYTSDTYATPVGLIARVLGCKLVYHEHDIPDTSEGSRFMRLLFAARRAALRRAELVVVPSQGRAAAIEGARGAGKIQVVWNCPSRAEFRQHQRAGDSSPLQITYQGSIVPARLPVTVVEAIGALAGRARLTVIGYETTGAPGYVAMLRERAAQLGVGGSCEFLGRVSLERKLEVAAAADLGIALMPLRDADINERTMAGASNKPFEYLGCGTPLLVSDLPDWRTLFVDRGVALACESTAASELAAIFEWAVTHRAELSAMGRAGQALVEDEWNYETQFRPVLKLMSDERG